MCTVRYSVKLTFLAIFSAGLSWTLLFKLYIFFLCIYIFSFVLLSVNEVEYTEQKLLRGRTSHTRLIDSAFHLSRDYKLSTGECQGKVGIITSVGWQVTLCDSMTSGLSSALEVCKLINEMRYTNRRILYYLVSHRAPGCRQHSVSDQANRLGQLGCESAVRLLLFTTTIAMYFTQPEGRYSFNRPTEGRRLSWHRH